MGLDMYLRKTIYIGNNYKDADEQVRVSGGGVKQERLTETIETVGYWRKANAIHKWFVDNVQKGVDDCGSYAVQKEHLEELLSLTKQVWLNHRLAKKLLPTQSGFFYGQTEYNDWYFQDIEQTKEILENVLAEMATDEKNKVWADYYYHSSW